MKIQSTHKDEMEKSVRKRKVLIKGFVKFHDVSGNDFTVINTTVVIDQHENLMKVTTNKTFIETLFRKQQMRPFEQITFRFHIKAPKFLATEWFGLGLGKFSEQNEWAEVETDYYVPENIEKISVLSNPTEAALDVFTEEEQTEFRSKIENFSSWISGFIKKLSGKGIIKQQYEMLQPQNVFTQFYWTVNAKDLMEWIKIQKDSAHEQQEYAEAILEWFFEKMPWTANIFVKKELDG